MNSNTQTHSPECHCNHSELATLTACSCACHQANQYTEPATKSEAKRLFIQHGGIPDDVNEATKKIMEEYAGTFESLAKYDKTARDAVADAWYKTGYQAGVADTIATINARLHSKDDCGGCGSCWALEALRERLEELEEIEALNKL